MITLKYEKKSPAIFVSHIDLLRTVVRIIRRTGLSPEFSQGFNPHMLLFFSPPLALGVQSECEYVTVDINGVTAKDFAAEFNKASIEGITATASFMTEKSPNLAGTIVSADYFFPTENGVCTAEIADFFAKKEDYEIEYAGKNGVVAKKVARLIYDVKKIDGGLIFRLATGNDNLRADRLCAALKKDFGLDTSVASIVKLRQFMSYGKETAEVDGVLTEGKII